MFDFTPDGGFCTPVFCMAYRQIQQPPCKPRVYAACAPKICRSGTLCPIQEPGEQPPVVLIPAVSINTISRWGACVSNGTGKCVVAMLASEALAVTPVVLYPVQFTAELRIEQENVSRPPLQSLVDESSRF